jgi:hypothetical protein
MGKEDLSDRVCTNVLKFFCMLNSSLRLCQICNLLYIMTRNIVIAALVDEVSNFISLPPHPSITSHIHCAGKCVLILQEVVLKYFTTKCVYRGTLPRYLGTLENSRYISPTV